MSREVISIKEFKVSKRLAYRALIDKMSKLELMGEFMSVMNSSAGKQWTIEEARDCEFLIERLLSVSDSDLFKYQLQTSLKTLREEIARLRN